MTAQGYAFSFDARFCSGCKACQAACKDKNNLPPGVLLRRVFEVTGGTWRKDGEAWRSTVFAYNLSIACNHCVHPKCAGICPTGAYSVREDGIVILDATKCMGCGYCSWACPYGAPQYNPAAGQMTKCDFCFDNLDQGLPPACVAACPMRVLDYREMAAEPAVNEISLWESPAETHPYPLPGHSHTQPRLVIKPHPAMEVPAEKFVANQEEIQPRRPSKWEEVPLILFTLLTQMAVGGIWSMLWIFPGTWLSREQGTTLLRLLPLLLIGLSFGAGALASFAHLGTKKNTVYVFRNLRRSWLSREVLFTAFFGLGWLLTVLTNMTWRRGTLELTAVTATLGLGLVYSMSKVYRLPAAPGWNTWRTNIGFMMSALLLGLSLMVTLLAYESNWTGIHVRSSTWIAAGTFLFISLLTQAILIDKWTSRDALTRVRRGLILVGMLLSAVSLFKSQLDITWLSTLIFLIVIMEESLGRWLFYQSRNP